MVFKIMVDNKNILTESFESLIKLGDTILYNGNMYINSDKDLTIKKILKSKSNPKDQIFVIKLTIDNLNYEQDSVKKWCEKILIAEELRKIEIEAQEELKNTDLFLDRMKIELDKQNDELKKKEMNKVGRKEKRKT